VRTDDSGVRFSAHDGPLGRVDGPDALEPEAIPADPYLDVLADTVEALRGTPYLLVGGIASAILGRPRISQDIDVFVRPGDADPALDRLARAGFETALTGGSRQGAPPVSPC
jgi:hypothetical protein